jgi:lysine 6-dehydrogenase
MPKKVIVLGTGLVGNAIAIDLAKKYDTSAVDISTKYFARLQEHNVKTLLEDLSDLYEMSRLIADYDLVIGALPGHMGYKTLKKVIETGKNIVDISFMPEDFMTLDHLAKKNKITAVVDCGVAPGMGNLILGYHNSKMKVDSFTCYVGGLPIRREWPFEYKAVFSPIDVIEEYMRPARYVEKGHLVVKDALSDIELIDFKQIGTLEAWNSDGLRSLLITMEIPNMIEKTLRYPGTTQNIKILRETGFFSHEEIEVRGVKIKPIDVTSQVLFPKWQLQPGEGDFTIMRIIISGEQDGKKLKYVYELYDSFDADTDTLSMARTTGYTCTAVANLILQDKYKEHGISPPEYVGAKEGNYEAVMAYLRERGVNYEVRSRQ